MNAVIDYNRFSSIGATWTGTLVESGPFPWEEI